MWLGHELGVEAASNLEFERSCGVQSRQGIAFAMNLEAPDPEVITKLTTEMYVPRKHQFP